MSMIAVRVAVTFRVSEVPHDLIQHKLFAVESTANAVILKPKRLVSFAYIPSMSSGSISYHLHGGIVGFRLDAICDFWITFLLTFFQPVHHLHGRQDPHNQETHQQIQVRCIRLLTHISSCLHSFQAPSVRSVPWRERGMAETKGY